MREPQFAPASRANSRPASPLRGDEAVPGRVLSAGIQLGQLCLWFWFVNAIRHQHAHEETQEQKPATGQNPEGGSTTPPKRGLKKFTVFRAATDQLEFK